MKTRVTELLGIEYPVLQGAMAWIADGGLAAAVSEAGGLGIIAGGNAPIDYLREEIRKVKAKTDKPFGVNIMLMSPNAEELAQLVVDERVPVVTTGAGNPAPYMEKWKQAGVKIIPVIPTVALAQRMQKLGADAVIAEGTESGGHIGELTTMALVPQVYDAVDIPVIAAGGIADGRGLAAAVLLGAAGVQMGTRFLACDECTVHDNYKQKVLKARDTDSVVTGRATGAPVRSLRNRLTRQFNELEAKESTLEEYEALGSDSLRKAAKDGEVQYGSVMAGQIAGMVRDLRPAKDIVHDITKEAENLLSHASEIER